MAATIPSFWLHPAPQPGSPLEDRLSCEVAIVGAGYMGLSCALELARRGVDVAVVESDYAGFGASGRNAGQLTPTIGKDLPSVLRSHGRETGGALARLADEAVEFTEGVIADRAIDCDYVPSGTVVAGLHPGQERKLRKAASAGIELGAQLEWLTPDQLAERDLPAFVACGYRERRGGVLDPGKYVRALRAAALAEGVALFEQSPVTAIEQRGGRVGVRTARGELDAASCLLATNAFSPGLGFLRRLIVPISCSMIATAPLTAEQRGRVGWSGKEGIYTAHESLESYRLTADGRIVFGSRPVRNRYGSRIPPDDDRGHFARVERQFRTRFPGLADVTFEHHWSGPMAFPMNFLPSIGRVGDSENLHYAIGCVGHGVAMASHLGTLAAGVVLGESRGPEVLAARRRLPLPPEPLLWLGVRAIVGSLNAIDRVTDRRAAPRT
jgi:glycine/D-amino acid oxidase-like deaminating enzyme